MAFKVSLKEIPPLLQGEAKTTACKQCARSSATQVIPSVSTAEGDITHWRVAQFTQPAQDGSSQPLDFNSSTISAQTAARYYQDA